MEAPKSLTPESAADKERRAVLFIRVNRHGVGDDAAAEAQVERQRQRGKDVARQLGTLIVREYVDHGGGVSVEQRPAIEAMLDDLTAKRDTDYVIVDDLARLTRRADDMVVIERVVEDAGARLVIGEDGLQGQMVQPPHGFDEAPLALSHRLREGGVL